jgi:hypothetical protein
MRIDQLDKRFYELIQDIKNCENKCLIDIYEFLLMDMKWLYYYKGKADYKTKLRHKNGRRWRKKNDN